MIFDFQNTVTDFLTPLPFEALIRVRARACTTYGSGFFDFAKM
jgi:hypothetical protein